MSHSAVECTVVCALVFAAMLGAQDVPDSVRVRAVTDRTNVYVGEVFELRVEVEVERAFRRDNLIQLFQRRLDVPLQVRTPWRTLPEGVMRRPSSAVAAATQFAVDDAVVGAAAGPARVDGARTFDVFELRQALVAAAPGVLEFTGPSATFAFATRFEDDFLNGRMPVDRRDATVDGDGLRITVAPLPTAGRPAGFGGALGRFTITGTVAPERVDVGATLTLTLRITGDGDLTTCEPPRLDGFDGFHVLGQLDDRGSPVRTIVVELVPQRTGLTTVPPVAFEFFDPAPDGGYRTTATDALPIRVDGPAGVPPPEPVVTPPTPVVAPGVTDIHDLRTDLHAHGPTAPRTRVLSPWTLGIATAVAWLAAGVWIVAFRPRARRTRRVGVAHAQRVFDARVRARPAELADAFVDFVATLLDVQPAAVVDPRLADRLRAQGVDRALAAQVAETVERAVAVRYGAPGALDAAAVTRLAHALAEGGLR